MKKLYLRVAALGRLRTTGLEDLNQEHGRTALPHSFLPLVPLALAMVFCACLLPTSCAALRAQAFLLRSELPRWRQKREAYCAQKQNGVVFPFFLKVVMVQLVAKPSPPPPWYPSLLPLHLPSLSFLRKVAELKRSPVNLSFTDSERGIGGPLMFLGSLSHSWLGCPCI